MAVIWMGTGRFAPAYDTDAQAYITAVEAADTAAGQSGGLETAVKDAINAFVVGCKADGIWSAIKASCILAGARTLSGCLVPLVGTAPTNNNFVSGDYNRKTGLKGNKSNKYLNSNRASNADPQNNFHMVINVTVADTTTSFFAYLGEGQATTGATHLTQRAMRCRSTTSTSIIGSTESGFIGASRTSASLYSYRFGGIVGTDTPTSSAPTSNAHYVFGRNISGSLSAPTDARIAFYSIGESLDLALLDARVTTLINAIAAAIP